MYSFAIHESRNLKQARPNGQYVDLLRYTLATPSWDFISIILPLSVDSVKHLSLLRSPPTSNNHVISTLRKPEIFLLH